MKWFVRTVRGAFLVALVVAVVASADYLMAMSRSAPGAALPSDYAAAQVVGADPSDASLSADADVADEPVDLSDDLIDADRAAPPAADSEPTLDLSELDPSEIAQPSDLNPLEVVQLTAGALPEGSTTSQGQYKRSVIADLAYGNGAANVGLSTTSEKRPAGPASFAVDASGAVFVSDNVNGRVQVFSGQGSHLRSLSVDTYVYDLATGDANDLYLLGVDGGLVVQDATTGTVKATGAASGVAAEDLGKLRVANGQLSLESPYQVAYPLGVSKSGGMTFLSSQEQQNGQKNGTPARSQDRYTTSYLDGGHVYRLDNQGKTIQDIALRLPDIATIVFLQEDRSGNIYVQVERVSIKGQVSVEVRQLGQKGELIATVPIDSVDYLPMTKSAVVADDGTIYQLVPTAQGVALVKYQRS